METGTALITGGAGFIGCAIAPLLLERFERVVAFDNLHPQIHPNGRRPDALPGDVEFVHGDVTDPAAWAALLARGMPEVILHLAAETGTGQSLTESTRHTMVNVVGTSTMLDALSAQDSQPRRIVLASSRAVYGEGAWRGADGMTFYPAQRTRGTLDGGVWDVPGAEPLPMDARSVEPRPVSMYAATKLAQEHLIRSWANSFGVETAVLRLQNVYGPGQAMANPYTGIMTLFCRFAREGRSIPLYEDGEVRRDFVLIDDVAGALVAAATVVDPPSDVLDIGSGEHQTISTAAHEIAAAYGAPRPHVTGRFREGDVRHAWAEVGPATAGLGWQPRHGLHDGVSRLISWIESQPSVPPLNA